MTVYSQKSAEAIEKALSDIRVDQAVLAMFLGSSDEAIKEKLFNLSLLFIRDLASQHEHGAYRNGGMNVALRAWETQQKLFHSPF